MHKKMPTVLFQNSIWHVRMWPFTDYFWREGWRGSPSSVSFSDENWAGNWGLVQKENRSQTLSSGATKREITAWKCHSLPSRRKGRNLSQTLQLKSLTNPFTAQITTSVKLSSNKWEEKRTCTFPHNSWPREQRQNWCLKCFFHTWTFTSLKSECTSLVRSPSLQVSTWERKSFILRVYINMICIRE